MNERYLQDQIAQIGALILKGREVLGQSSASLTDEEVIDLYQSFAKDSYNDFCSAWRAAHSR